jgi:hypothetical protein
MDDAAEATSLGRLFLWPKAEATRNHPFELVAVFRFERNRDESGPSVAEHLVRAIDRFQTRNFDSMDLIGCGFNGGLKG